MFREPTDEHIALALDTIAEEMTAIRQLLERLVEQRKPPKVEAEVVFEGDAQLLKGDAQLFNYDEIERRLIRDLSIAAPATKPDEFTPPGGGLKP